MVKTPHLPEETSFLLNVPNSPRLYYLILLKDSNMGSNNNDILDRLCIVDKYVQIAVNKLYLLKQVNT